MDALPLTPDSVRHLIDRGFNNQDFKVYFGLDKSPFPLLKEWGIQQRWTKHKGSNYEVVGDVAATLDKDRLFFDAQRMQAGVTTPEELHRIHQVPTSAAKAIYDRVIPRYATMVACRNGSFRKKVGDFDGDLDTRWSPNEFFARAVEGGGSVGSLCISFHASPQSVVDYLSRADRPSPVGPALDVSELASMRHDDLVVLSEKMESGEISFSDSAQYLVCSDTKTRDLFREFHGHEYKNWANKSRHNRIVKTSLEKFGVAHLGQREDVKKKIRDTKESRTVNHPHMRNNPDYSWDDKTPKERENLIYDLIIRQGYLRKDIPSVVEGVRLSTIQKMCKKMNLPNHQYKQDRSQFITDHIERLRKRGDIDDLVKDLSEGVIDTREFIKQLDVPPHMEKEVISQVVSAYAEVKASSRTKRSRAKNMVSSRQILFTSSSVERGVWLQTYGPFESTHHEYLTFHEMVKSEDYTQFFPFARNYVKATGQPDTIPNSRIESALGIRFSVQERLTLENEGIFTIDEDWRGMSSPEKKLREFLISDLDIDGVEFNNTNVLSDKRELDVMIPDKKIAIELNPTSTHHSNKFIERTWAKPKPDSYHAKKFIDTEKELDYTLIQLFSWDLCEPNWSEVTAPRLAHLITGPTRRVYGRNTRVKEITTKEAKDFCLAHHSGGYVAAKHKYALVDNSGEYVCVFTVGEPQNPAFKKRRLLEIKRIAFPAGVSVVGGVSKIASHIKRTYADTYSGVMTYSDNSWGRGDGYRKSGFTLESNGRPSARFVVLERPHDWYSWSVASPWGARSGVIAQDLSDRGLPSYNERPFNPEEYVELELTQRDGVHRGYWRVMTPGSRLWTLMF